MVVEPSGDVDELWKRKIRGLGERDLTDEESTECVLLPSWCGRAASVSGEVLKSKAEDRGKSSEIEDLGDMR